MTHTVTPETRRKVEIAAGGGMTQDEIGIMLGITRQTLAKYYERELSTGAYERRAEIMEALFNAGLKGNASAAKQYLSGIPEVAPPPITDAAPAEKPPVEARPAALGKKERQQLEAKTAQAGTEWADLLPGNRMPQ